MYSCVLNAKGRKFIVHQLMHSAIHIALQYNRIECEWGNPYLCQDLQLHARACRICVVQVSDACHVTQEQHADLNDEMVPWSSKGHERAAYGSHATGHDDSVLCPLKQCQLRSKSLHAVPTFAQAMQETCPSKP